MSVKGDVNALAAAIQDKASYKYILNLRKKQTSKEYIETYGKIVKVAYDAYIDYLKLTVSDIWLRELDAVEKAFDLGVANKWSYKIVL